VLDFEDKVGQEAARMADAAQNQELKGIFQKTVSKSREYAQRAEQTFQELGQPVTRNENHIAAAMMKEVEGMIASTDMGPVRDAALIVAANQQQMFRVASYGSLAEYAALIGSGKAEDLLKQTLTDSKAGDEKLNRIAEQTVNPQAKAA
jgi:ferritin-like metal-binding protein YciE